MPETKESLTIAVIASIINSIFVNSNSVGIGSREHDFGEDDYIILLNSLLESYLK